MSQKVYWDKTEDTIYMTHRTLYSNPSGRHPKIIMPFGEYEHLRVRTCLLRDKSYDPNKAPMLDSPRKTYDVVKEMGILPAETLVVLLRTGSGQCLGIQEVHIGGTSFTIIDIKQVLKAALIANVDTIIVVHNHPSGNVLPSEADRLIAKRLNSACLLLDLKMVDFVIVAGDEFYSFQEHGVMP